MAPTGSTATGFLNVDKPAGWTSHDVVARCRRLLGLRRVGHAGTLDPDATGVLVVAAGPATRLLRFLAPLTKRYEGEMVLGVATSTLDAAGEVTGRWDMAGVDLGRLRAAAAGLTGDIMQVPPMVSAVQVGGRRLHDLARQGIEVERAPRAVTVERFDVTPGSEPSVFCFEVDCSSGTYVRVLVADLGEAVGGGAHLRRLRRTAVGPFAVDDAVPLDRVGPDRLMPPAAALSFLPTVALGDEGLDAVRHGRPITAPEAGAEGPWALTGPAGELVAVYEGDGRGGLRAAVVLAPA
ncbi:MAG TPA: tRNA pseudouridine(55) synthase TruB [Acidimicrobiales bacterium]|nr:tRNA pseudouridine(55) synthase TruB [Acidimicrobiales bacterium]